jgi:hypothetical protein
VYNYPRLRFVTANYENLQGLRAAPLALWITAVGIVQVGSLGPRWLQLLVVASILPASLLYLLIGAYYHRMFGRVRQQRSKAHLAYLALFGLCFAGLAIDIWLHPPVFALGFAVMLIFAAYWWEHREFRLHYLLVGLISGLISLVPLVALLANGQVIATLNPPFVSIFNITFGVMWLLLCVVDHLILLRSFAPATLESQDAHV